MFILSIDTALRNCNVVLAQNNEVLHELALGDEVKHSSRVLEAVESVLNDAGISLNKLSGLAVTTGPGSFTGLRIGMSTVKGLAFALNLPVAGLCVLEALALQAEILPDMPVMAVIDGGKQEVFTRCFSVNALGAMPLGDYANLGYKDAAENISAKVVLTGNGVPLLKPFLTPDKLGLAYISANAAMPITNQTLAKLAFQKFSGGHALNGGAVTPNYIRKSDAELNLLKA